MDRRVRQKPKRKRYFAHGKDVKRDKMLKKRIKSGIAMHLSQKKKKKYPRYVIQEVKTTTTVLAFKKNGCAKIRVNQIKARLQFYSNETSRVSHTFDASVAETRSLILPVYVDPEWVARQKQ